MGSPRIVGVIALSINYPFTTGRCALRPVELSTRVLVVFVFGGG